LKFKLVNTEFGRHMAPTISIAIPCKFIDNYTSECIQHCLELDYPNFEVLVLPDAPATYPNAKVKIIPTGDVKPPVKRNRAWEIAAGEIIAYLDSDSYPAKDWLKRAVKYFEDPQVWAVGGPGVTPPTDNLMQKASGLIMSTPICSGNACIRYKPIGSTREVVDWITCNFLIRRSALAEIGGFDPSFWPGDDSQICNEIVRRGRKILYAPDLLVYHHRRSLFREHLKQVGRFGWQRGRFVWLYPETSRKPIYFLPSIFVVCLIVGTILSFFYPIVHSIYLLIVAGYALGVLASAVKIGGKLFPLVWLGIVLTHIVYGLRFMQGLIAGRQPAHLQRES